MFRGNLWYKGMYFDSILKRSDIMLNLLGGIYVINMRLYIFRYYNLYEFI